MANSTSSGAPHFSAVRAILSPALGLGQAPAHRRGDPVVTDHHHAQLKAVLLACRPTDLKCHSQRVRPLFDPAGLVYHPGLQRVQMGNDLATGRRSERFFTPGAVGWMDFRCP